MFEKLFYIIKVEVQGEAILAMRKVIALRKQAYSNI